MKCGKVYTFRIDYPRDIESKASMSTNEKLASLEDSLTRLDEKLEARIARLKEMVDSM